MIKDTDSAHWKFGFLYFNPEQPRLFVAKRYGGPATLNLARPTAWIIIATPLAVMIAGAIFDTLHRIR